MENIKEITSPELGESYYHIVHPSGLNIYVMPKETYTSNYAVFGTKYGSTDTRFKRSDEADYVSIPEGTAHFLEHKLFESEDLDAFERFAQTGASANAYTSFEQTAYLFSSSGQFEDSLRILLDFVQSPYFTQETVEKEQGIIGQEINMYRDEPGWEVMFGCLRAMYHNHPVRIDIAGTEESIAEITADTLYRCYNTFYNLNNMALCVAGNITVEQVLSIADEMLKSSEKVTVQKVLPKEPKEVVLPYVEKTLAVNVPMFMIGYKENYPEEIRSLKHCLAMQIALRVLAGKSSPLYQKLFKKGLINTSFSAEYFFGSGYSSLLFSGESTAPQTVAFEVNHALKELQETGITNEDFLRIRNKLYGHEIMSYNDVDDLATKLLHAHFDDYGMFDTLQILKEITVEDVNAAFTLAVDVDDRSLSIVRSKPKNIMKEMHYD